MTLRGKTLFFIALLLFAEAFLFKNLLTAVLATGILLLLVYAHQCFKLHYTRIDIDRTIFEQQRFAQHPITIKTTIQHHGGPVSITATDHLPNDAELISGNNTTHHTPQPGEAITLEYQAQFTRRGTHTFNHLTLDITDTPGLFTTNSIKTQETPILVHADPREIKKAKRMATREHVEITAPSLTGAETQYEMEGIREYQPGDRLRDIEWKATSRLQHLMTKRFQQHEILDTTILIDCSRRMRRTTTNASKLEHATQLAIHLTEILQSLRHPVGLIAYDEHKILRAISPTRNPQAVFRELTQLPNIIPTQKEEETPSSHPQVEKQQHTPEEHRFIQQLFPFLSGTPRQVAHPLQATGVYEATRRVIQPLGRQSNHLIFISDLETNPRAHYTAINQAHSKGSNVWMLTMFTPLYDTSPDAVTSEHVEHTYQRHHEREKILARLKRRNVDVIELTPRLWAGKIIETIRKGKT